MLIVDPNSNSFSTPKELFEENCVTRFCGAPRGKRSTPKVVKQTLQDFLIKDYISRYVFVLNTSIYFPIEYTVYIYIYMFVLHTFILFGTT